jgi:hypothetical protein
LGNKTALHATIQDKEVIIVSHERCVKCLAGYWNVKCFCDVKGGILGIKTLTTNLRAEIGSNVCFAQAVLVYIITRNTPPQFAACENTQQAQILTHFSLGTARVLELKCARGTH